MSGQFKTTVDACIEWLGDQVETISRDPRATLQPRFESRHESWERAEALLVHRLTGEDPLIIGSTLGQGGEGVVHEAEQRSLGRMVAVKTLRSSHRSSTAALSLLREAWVLGRLEHPNILPIHDLRRDAAGLPQAVLKRIEGIEWEEIVADPDETRKRFGVDLFEHNLDVLLQVCQAVRFAHSRGVVHRDLKPGNVMIGGFGEVYLLDWGIAVVVDDVAGLPRTELDGTIAGTPSYMAPEMLGAPQSGLPLEMRTGSLCRHLKRGGAQFELHGTDVVIRRMESVVVVEVVDVIGKDGVSVVEAGEGSVAQALVLEGREEALGHGVVPAITLPTHAPNGACLVEYSDVRVGAVGALPRSEW